VQKTPINTGIIPYYLMTREDSAISQHPLSTLAAIGPLAKSMMEHNLEGDKPSSHGPNSSWKFCLDHNALIIGLGIDLVHYLTIMHVVEEAFPGWPVKDWYRERKFKIIDKDFERDIIVKERWPKWGTLFFAEKNLKKLLLKENILQVDMVGSIGVSLMDAKAYVLYAKSNNVRKGFPYVINKKYMF
jgi:aminoglycoside 3-N-acetyltransferase